MKELAGHMRIFDQTDSLAFHDGKLGLKGLTVTFTGAPKEIPADDQLQFGTVFTDHMFVMDYNEREGWHRPRVVPHAALKMQPAALVFHYAQAVFDGLKAYRKADGSIQFFRPGKHAERLNDSCQRLCIPKLDPDLILKSFHILVGIDSDWVPKRRGTALYLRPIVIASEAFIGARPSAEYQYFLILSPVGTLFESGLKPISILATDEYVRAIRGGVGAVKTAGSYAAGIYAAEEARKQGFAQVLWLDAVERRYLDEVGTMNVMMKITDEVITPPLTGAILPGITRDSVLTLCREWGLRVSERMISIDEVIDAAKSNCLTEMWGTGTAAIISPIGELGFRGEKFSIGNGMTGALTQRLYDTITGIQHGDLPDRHDWTMPLACWP
jgi:branched-chain amino acid aminotransferase